MEVVSEVVRLAALVEDSPGMGTGRLSQLQPSSLREQARGAIRASIVTGEIEAGTIHPVSYFATRLGVSATPIREALFDLVNEGLIEQIRNRGFRVSLVTDEDLDQLFELRTLLEVPSIGRVASRATPRDLEECVEFANEIEKHAARGDLVGFLEWDRQFHSRLLAVLGNRRLVDEVQRLRDQTRLYGLRGLDGFSKRCANGTQSSRASSPSGIWNTHAGYGLGERRSLGSLLAFVARDRGANLRSQRPSGRDEGSRGNHHCLQPLTADC
jgi:DNA-binding GntR family transcriptional regulator